MGWDKGRYYTRSKKVNGRVVREYIGGGAAGALVARWDAILRDGRQTDRECARLARDHDENRDRQVGEIVELADLLARAALRAAGYHQHHRGEWRKRRGRDRGGPADAGRTPGPAPAGEGG